MDKKAKMKCIKHLCVYTFLDLTCDLTIFKKSSQVESLFDFNLVDPSQVVFSPKNFQVKSSQVTSHLT